DDAVGALLRSSRLLLQDQALERVQQRGVAAARELLAERMTELLELLGARERREERPIRKPSLQLRLLDRDGQGADPDRVARVRIAQRALHGAEVGIGRAHEEDSDLLPLQPVRHDELVRTLDERSIGRAGLDERVHLRLERVAAALGAANVLLQSITLGIAEPVRGQRDADEDADDEREEDR